MSAEGFNPLEYLSEEELTGASVSETSADTSQAEGVETISSIEEVQIIEATDALGTEIQLLSNLEAIISGVADDDEAIRLLEEAGF